MIIRDRFFLLEQSESFTSGAAELPENQGTCRIVINLGDTLQCTVGGSAAELFCHHFQIIPPDQEFTVVVPLSLGAKFLYLSLEPGFWEICAFCAPRTVYSAAESCLADRDIRNILSLVSKTISEYQMESQAYYAFRYSWISEILMNLFRNPAQNCTDVLESSVIPEIIRFLENNYTEKISIDMLSSKFYISKYHLMRQFKKETGSTIHNFILNKRISHACSLMLRQVTPSEACYLSGFTDYSLFFKTFTKITGFSPSQYPSGLHSQTG